MDWPSQSPDLNPIKNLWGHLDRMQLNRRPANENELFEIIKEGWNKLEVLLKTVKSVQIKNEFKGSQNIF